MSVGVDAALSPAMRNCRIAHTIGEHAQRLVGADASVRPWGNDKFATTYRKIERASRGSMWASTPTNVVWVCIGACVFAGASCRADRGVRPYGCIPSRIGADNFPALCRREGVEPLPYGSTGNAVKNRYVTVKNSLLHSYLFLQHCRVDRGVRPYKTKNHDPAQRRRAPCRIGTKKS